MRLGGVAPSALKTLDGAARDVAELGERFEEQLEHAKVVDLGAPRHSDAGCRGRQPRMPIVLLDVPIGGRAERDFIDVLTAMSPAALVTVPAGDDATLDALRPRSASRG